MSDDNVLEELTRILVISKSMTPKITHTDEPSQLCAVALWGTLIEHAMSVIKLIEVNSTWGIDCILRNMLEAHMDLINLGKVEDYFARLQLTSFIEGRKLEEEFDEDTSESDSYIKDLEGKGYKKLTLNEKLKLASDERVARVAYRVLSMNVHNNMQALISRHFIKDKDGNFERIEYFRPKTDIELDRIIDTTAGMLTTGIEIIAAILEIDLIEEISAAKSELDKLRNT
jgi:hypothetical protein